MDDDHFHDEYDDDPEAVEGYCMRCRQSVEIQDAVPVWTRKGMPATRGECPICGGLVFRMGKTDQHREHERPMAVQVGESGRRASAKLARDTVYVNYASSDEELAQQISADLEKSGIAVWLHETHDEPNPVKWAGGVHPALKQCERMIYVLSPNALAEGKVEAAWKFFRDKRKPVIIAQVAAAEPPDAIRRSPRFDFTGDYKAAFRQMLQSLSK